MRVGVSRSTTSQMKVLVYLQESCVVSFTSPLRLINKIFSVVASQSMH